MRFCSLIVKHASNEKDMESLNQIFFTLSSLDFLTTIAHSLTMSRKSKAHRNHDHHAEASKVGRPTQKHSIKEAAQLACFVLYEALKVDIIEIILMINRINFLTLILYFPTLNLYC